MTDDDDATLLRRYAETRSEPAFAALVQRHLDLVYSAALRRLSGDTHHAADVAQSVFLALARHAATLAGRPVLIGWLYTTTRHAAIDLIRAEQRRRTREHHAHVMDTVNAPATPPADWDQLRPLLDAAMDQLGEREREIVLLRFFENRSFADVGGKLSLSEDAARMRATRALEKLRHLLARHGVTSTAAALGTALAGQTITAAPASLAATITTSALTGTASLTALSLTVMTATTKTLLTAAAVTVLTLGTAVFYQARQAHDAQRSLATAQQDLTSLRTQNSALAARLAAITADRTRLNSLPKEPTAKASPAPKVTLTTLDREWTIPGYGRATVERERATLGLRYARLYHDLQLTPEQIALFEKAMIERSQSIADVNTEAAAQGLSPNDNIDVTRLKTEAYEALNQTLRALLGDSGFGQYQLYEKGTKTRDLVASFAGSIYFSEAPLTAAQGTELVRILMASTQTKLTPRKDEGTKTIYSGRDEIDWAKVATQSQVFLSPTQLAVLNQLAEKQRAETEMIRLSQSQVRN